MQAVMRISAAADAALMIIVVILNCAAGSAVGLDDGDGRVRDKVDTDEGVGIEVSSKMMR